MVCRFYRVIVTCKQENFNYVLIDFVVRRSYSLENFLLPVSIRTYNRNLQWKISLKCVIFAMLLLYTDIEKLDHFIDKNRKIQLFLLKKVTDLPIILCILSLSLPLSLSLFSLSHTYTHEHTKTHIYPRILSSPFIRNYKLPHSSPFSLFFSLIPFLSLLSFGPVGWVFKIHWLHLCRRVRLPQRMSCGPVGWVFKIHWLHLCRRVRLPQRMSCGPVGWVFKIHWLHLCRRVRFPQRMSCGPVG